MIIYSESLTSRTFWGLIRFTLMLDLGELDFFGKKKASCLKEKMDTSENRKGKKIPPTSAGKAEL